MGLYRVTYLMFIMSIVSIVSTLQSIGKATPIHKIVLWAGLIISPRRAEQKKQTLSLTWFF